MLFRSPTPSSLAAYSDLFERLLDPTFLLDPDSWVVLEVNSAGENAFGLKGDEIIGRRLDVWVEQENRDEFSKGLRVAMRRYYPRKFESSWKLQSGQVVYTELTACPLKLSDETQVMQVIARDITARHESDLKIQNLLAEVQEANKKLEILSTVDEMTGLYNFRHFKNDVIKEHARCARYGSQYALIFCDLDHFKKYNDRNGHPAGDRLLKKLANILSKNCRVSDRVARYGGEEFVLICPEIDEAGALVLAERLREMVQLAAFPFAEHQPLGFVSLSMGVASFPQDGKTHEDVLQAADEAVYQSKSQGRNRVTVASSLAKKPVKDDKAA